MRRCFRRSVVYFLADRKLLLVQFDGLLVVAHCAVSVAHVAVGAAHSGAVTQRSRNRQVSLKVATQKMHMHMKGWQLVKKGIKIQHWVMQYSRHA
jgi:hypothetical protein